MPLLGAPLAPLLGAHLAPLLGAPLAPFLGAPLVPLSGAPLAPLLGGACGSQNGFKNFRWGMRIPNMCLVLKLDNGKVISIADGQNHRAIQYRISI